MTTARLHCTFVLLLYLKFTHGQQTLSNNQNIGVNNAKGLQQYTLQRTSNNINQVPNVGLNINLPPQSNLQQSPSLSGSKQGNLQQSLGLPSNLQSQSASLPQNNLQITKLEYTPVSSANNPYAAMQLQNGGVSPNVQVISSQNIPISNTPMSQVTNAPISSSTLAELVALKGQNSLLSLFNSQNTGQTQQPNQQIVVNAIPAQNQLTDLQKQFLVRSLQSQTFGQNQQGINFVQAQPRIPNVENQQSIALRGIQGAPQQAQAIVTPLGNQPAYITVQAQPLTNFLQNQPLQAAVEEEPSLLSIILSELGPQYAVDSAFTPLKKGSKPNLKTLIPLIINLLKEKNNCACRNCGCQNNAYQNNAWPNPVSIPEPQMAQILGGYSSQNKYGQNPQDSPARIKKNDDDESRNNDKERKNKKETVVVESEELSEEDDSEYIDDGDE